jgi:hypothetical protein
VRIPLLLLALLLAGCRSAADFRAMPPDETRTYAGELKAFESAMLARHGVESVPMAYRTITDVTTPEERASNAIALWWATHDILGVEHEAFLLTARQSAPGTLSVEVRANAPVDDHLARAWGYVQDCLGPSLDSGPRQQGQ